MNMNEFKSVMEDPFGISKDFGTMLGNEIGQKPSQITSQSLHLFQFPIQSLQL